MAKYILQNNFDIVHANMFPTFYYCSIIKKFHRKKFPKLVMTEHSTDNHRRHHQLFWYIDRFIYRSYDHVISISDKTQEHLLNWISPNRTGRKKYSVAYDGIPLQTYYDARPYTRKNLFPAIAGNDRLVGMIGAFKEAKNHAMIIEVLSLLPLNYKLVLVGIGDL